MVVKELERLWAEHVAAVRFQPVPVTATRERKLGIGQGRRLDAKLRERIEDLA